MAWITPITDRTDADVKDAFDNQIGTTDKKGSLDYTDLNRIENNFLYVSDFLKTWGYYIKPFKRDITEKWFIDGIEQTAQRSDWQESDITYKSEIDRIRINLNKLSDGFLKYLGLPVFEFKRNLGYQEVNDWEKVELDSKEASEKMTEFKIYCGTQRSGGLTL